MSPALFFHPDAVETQGKDLVGRRSAGQTFLRGFLDHVAGDPVNVLTENAKGKRLFEETIRAMGETRKIDAASLAGDDFTRFGTIFFPVPGYLSAAWRRQRFGAEKCSLVGVTHTVSTRNVIEQLHNLMLTPVEPWDAIICTSHAVHSVVTQQFEHEAEFIRRRFGATRVPMPQFPVIPLGIEADRFVFSEAFRAEARLKYGAPDDAIVIMTMGRLTVVEKANPVPLYQTLEVLAQKLGKPVHLWQVGWASREEEAKLHREGPEAFCPSVTAKIIDGRDPWVRQAIWSGADIFTLPVDNIQETFGIVPVEAMAAGLPVVMPDWDGFRDTVVHGRTGFLIPTRMGNAGSGITMARRFADGTDPYLAYLSLTSQMVQIDQSAYLAAFEALARDPDLRKRMGAAGAAHVRANLDVAPVMRAHLRLADELAQMRNGAQATSLPLSPTAVSPIEVDPFELYRKYPSATFSINAVVRSIRPLTPQDAAKLDAFNGRDLYRRRTVNTETLCKVSQTLHEAGSMTAFDLARTAGISRHQVEVVLLYLAKYAYVALPTPDLRETDF